MSKSATFINAEARVFMDELQVCILPGNYSGMEFSSIYEDVFNFWHLQWSKTFSALKVPFSTKSDEFSRHEEFIAILHSGKVIACALAGYFNLANSVHRAHTYFSEYSQDIVTKIRNLAADNPVFTLGYLTIDLKFRRRIIADLVLGIQVRRIQESLHPLMIAYTRNSKGMHNLSYRLGGKPLAQNLQMKNEPADFVYFDKSSMQVLIQHEEYSQINRLWQNKIYIPSLNILTKTHSKGKENEESRLETSI